ncbi:MAG TPA: hypothetical protein VJY35_15545 [Candidatus Eisenbacteria bacterium]|nr:hypothetical protein [Candidatus Eisenbacteria bacterium]
MSPPAHEVWRAQRNTVGQWIVTDETGSQPLSSSDPLVRIQAVHLAAAAPQLAAALKWLIEDLHRMEVAYTSHIRHRVRLNYAEVVLIESRAPTEDVLRLSRTVQLELDLAA